MFFLCCFLSITIWQHLNAEENTEDPVIKDCRLAIVAIGPKPPRRFGKNQSESSNGASTLLPPRIGELPPRKLMINLGDRHSTTNVNYNSKPTFITIPSNKRLNWREKSEQEKDYLTVEELDPSSVNLILLSASSLSPFRWSSKPKQFKLDLTSAAFQYKRLAFINLSKRPIKSKYDEKEVLLRPGQKCLHSILIDRNLHKVSAYYGSVEKTIFNSAVKFNKSKSIKLFIFYDANANTNDGRTVGLMRLRIDIHEELEKLVTKTP